MFPGMGRGHCSRSVRPLMPDLSTIEYKTAPARPSFPSKPTLPPNRPTSIQTIWAKARYIATSHFQKSSNHESLLLDLSPEMLLEIASHLPAASLASLALTCTALFSTLSSPTLFTSLELPTEQPLNFRSARMSKPFNYQPARQEFLSFLERDLKGEWQLCSECFILHPRAMFAGFEDSIAPWLRQYYTRHALNHRTCRHERKHLGAERSAIFAPVGIVDLCPCIKLTPRKKQYLETHLRQTAQSPPLKGGHISVAADFWWHQCQHSYHGGAVKLYIRMGIFLYDGTESERSEKLCEFSTLKTHIFSELPQAGRLGVLFDYCYTYPSSLTLQTVQKSPRFLCPHLTLDGVIQALLRCRDGHDQPGRTTVCTWCKELQYCQYCRTKVLNLHEVENTEAAVDTTTVRFQVERCFDDRLWSIQTVFPFWRRHLPLLSCAPFMSE